MRRGTGQQRRRAGEKHTDEKEKQKDRKRNKNAKNKEKWDTGGGMGAMMERRCPAFPVAVTLLRAAA